MLSEIETRIDESIEAKKEFRSQSGEIVKVVEKMVECFKNDGKVLVCGNGGSAADAQHISGELVDGFLMDRKGLPVIALTTDSSVLTAWSNDVDFQDVFARQVEALGKPGDILIGISTSGNSENIVRAFDSAKEIGMINISLTGRDGGKLKLLSDLNINSSSDEMPRIQECHVVAYHIICEMVEKEMFKGDGEVVESDGGEIDEEEIE